MDYLSYCVAISIFISIIALVLTYRTERRVITIDNREERRHKIDILIRCTNPETEQEALNEVYVAFCDSHDVVIALQKYHILLRMRVEVSSPFRKNRTLSLLEFTNQKTIDRMKKELIEAMCRDVKMGYGVLVEVTDFTRELLARYEWEPRGI